MSGAGATSSGWDLAGTTGSIFSAFRLEQPIIGINYKFSELVVRVFACSAVVIELFRLLDAFLFIIHDEYGFWVVLLRVEKLLCQRRALEFFAVQMEQVDRHWRIAVYRREYRVIFCAQLPVPMSKGAPDSKGAGTVSVEVAALDSLVIRVGHLVCRLQVHVVR